MERKLNKWQIEDIEHAMDYIHQVQMEIEESGKNKRIWNILDKCIGFLYDVIWR